MMCQSTIMLAILIPIIIESVIAGDNPIVETTYGQIRGVPLQTYNHDTFYAFQGVPFAEPPVGDLRFQPPQPPKNWEGVLDSQNAKKKCIQLSTALETGESEDCLYLNVYTPQLATNNGPLPVMVFIHGGAFVRGSGGIDELRPHKLMDYGILVVTIQYRVGLFGFLSTGDLVCPGNNGLKDQQMALEWVQANIRNFGGDPTRVTVAGQSAGAASVGYQLLGSNGKGLFRAAIQASGSSLGTWSLQRNPKGIATDVANYINPAVNENSTSEQLMSFFRDVNVSDVKVACAEIFGEGFVGGFFNTAVGFDFSGTIEPEHEGAFITETALKKFGSGDFNVVPLFIGITSEETLILKDDTNLEARLTLYDEYPELLVSPDMYITDVDVKKIVGNDIRRLYVGDGLLQENIGPSIKYFSDIVFGKPSMKQAVLVDQYTDVFFYEFAYSGALGRQGSSPIYIPGAYSVGHHEDMEYLFPVDREEVENYSEMDITTMERIVLLWSNFVKYLNPTPEPSDILQNVTWPKLSSSERFSYLYFNETLEIRYDLKKEMVDEYNRLYTLYAVPPLDTF